MQYDTTCSILLLGDACVGKPCLISRYANGVFKDDYISTVGFDFISKQEIINDKNINVKLWDTAGQENYRSITRSYYKNSICAMIVYDITNKDTFDNIKNWLNEIHNQSPKNVLIVLIGNKIDLDDRDISTEDAKKFAQENNFKYFETSAKSGIGVDELFREIV